MYGNSGRDITKYTVICGVYTRFWPTLCMCHVRCVNLWLPVCVCVCVCIAIAGGSSLVEVGVLHIVCHCMRILFVRDRVLCICVRLCVRWWKCVLWNCVVYVCVVCKSALN